MSAPLPVGPVHHLRLTVTDVARSRAFYTEVLGFQVVLDGPPPEDPGAAVADALQGGVILASAAGTLLGLRPADPGRAGDRFDPFRVGLDHVSFAVPGRADLDAAAARFDERGVAHGPVRELPGMGLAFLAAFDPDGIAVELTAPL
ncbi:VOC family protein [Geodermatophilus sp. SYSU D00703]